MATPCPLTALPNAGASQGARFQTMTDDDEIVIRKAERTPEGIALGIEMARLCDVAEAEQRARFPKQKPRCESCAFRAGTLPNGDPVTLMDATKCVIEKVPFMCHQYFNADGSPRDLCAGFMILMASGLDMEPRRAKTTVPWEFSKPVASE